VKIAKVLPDPKTRAPESVDFDEPPAKLITRLYKEKLVKTKYKKTIHGKALFSKLDPAIAYENCPKLRAMFDEMFRFAILKMGIQ
jgi:hypothetical protein